MSTNSVDILHSVGEIHIQGIPISHDQNIFFTSEVDKKVENVKINRLKVFPEKPYELARSYELAPYELAQHPCR